MPFKLVLTAPRKIVAVSVVRRAVSRLTGEPMMEQPGYSPGRRGCQAGAEAADGREDDDTDEDALETAGETCRLPP